MRLALIGDIHAFSLAVHPRRLLNRRIFAQSNLWLNRRFKFNHDLLDPLFDEVRRLDPQMLLCSGDLTTTSLEVEFAQVMAHLEPLADDIPVIAVPGNHDRYTFRSHRARRMEDALGKVMPEAFPYAKQLTDQWHLIALDSGRPNVLSSRGSLGQVQFEAFKDMLSALTEDDGLVVLCHYPAAMPPGIPSSWAHNLREATAIQRLLAQCAARVLYLHGHVHRPWYWVAAEDIDPEAHAEKAPRLAYLNAGAPCMTGGPYPLGQGFWQIDLPDDPTEDVQLIHLVPEGETYGPNRMVRITEARQGGSSLRWRRREVL